MLAHTLIRIGLTEERVPHSLTVSGIQPLTVLHLIAQEVPEVMRLIEGCYRQLRSVETSNLGL